MIESGLIDLTELKPRDFSKYFLMRNPFPAIGIPYDSIPFTVDRDSMKKRFKDVITELQVNNNSTITVLVGDYGSGKSHLLKLFKESVNNQLISQQDGIIAIYIKSPGEDFNDFFLQLIDDIGRSRLESYSEQFLKKYFWENRNKVADFIHDSSIREPFLMGNYELGIVLQKCRKLDLFDEIKKDSFKTVDSFELVSAFLHLSHPESGSKAWKWLLGEKLEAKDKDSLKVSTNIDNQDTAYFMFKQFFKLLNCLGIKAFVLLIDELERISLLHATKRTRYQEILRTMIDEYPEQLCIYFAIAPQQWEKLTSESTALIRRLAGNYSRLSDFDIKYTKELIATYLSYSRTDNYSAKLVKEKCYECDPQLYPFSPDAIDVIQNQTKGRISAILLACRDLLDVFYDSQTSNPDLKYISVEFVKEKFEEI